ncbi:hypothetical protein [Sphaerisporangium aureirubrum]|uniref:DUF3618 domain-containing protein n=1 Tax=Sphaerisporangium aureirubrum TaxID=1544736 RepID=A0ABW1NTX9_9ACTN
MPAARKDPREAVTEAVGSLAGMVADPKGGLARLRSSVPGVTLWVLAAGVLTGYWLGRRAVRRTDARESPADGPAR